MAVVALAFAAGFLALPADAADGADEARTADAAFDVAEFRVVGNTKLRTADVEAAVYPFLGPGRRMTDVESARAALEQAYRTAGFGTVYVDIPEQTVDAGIVRLRVTEGRLGRVAMSGAKYFSQRAIRAALPPVEPGTVPQLTELQARVAELNAQSADRSVVPILKAGSQPGTVDLTLKVDDRLPFHGGLEVNNAYTRDTDELRAVASLSYDNVFGRLDSLSLQYQTAPRERSQVGVFAASYAARIGDRGNRLIGFFVDSKSDVATVGSLNVIGTGRIYGLRWLQPLSASRAGTHALLLGVDYKDFRESVRVDPVTSLNTPISYANFSVTYTGSRRRDHYDASWNAQVAFGLRGVAGTTAEFADKRFGATPNYMMFRPDFEVTWRPFGPRSWALGLRAAGQYTPSPIISNEQFSIAGAAAVRGYLEAEELGDFGFNASLEGSAPILPLGSRFALRAFAFADAGRTGIQQPLPGETRSTDLSSYGAGLELIGERFLQGTLTYTHPTVSGDVTQAGDERWLFTVRGFW